MPKGDNIKSRENLRPVRSAEEAREKGKKGGIASGEARRRKADLREAIKIALEAEYKTPEGETQSGAEMLVVSLMTIAGEPKNKGAAVQAFNTIAKMLGQDVPENDDNDDDMVRAFLDALRDGV